jgi:hypothetical protein
VFWFSTLILIFCSSDQRSALHRAFELCQEEAAYFGAFGHFGHEAVCELLIAVTADVNGKDRCGFVS